MFKKLLIASCAAVVVFVPTTMASADPPVEEVWTDYFVLFPDVNVDKSVFINITARDFCDWLETGPVGPPPVLDDAVVARGVPTTNGAVVGRIDAELYIELWNFDDPSADLVGPCEDIQQQLDNGDDPFATGIAQFKAKTNDAFESDSRGITFGDRTSAVLVGQDGTDYHYKNVFRLTEQCNVPDMDFPSCYVDKSLLQER
jgi:hypothetical protein